jgi:hypothetical protein
MENRVNPHPQEDILTDHVAELRQIEKEGYELGVKRGRNTLFWIAGLMFAGEILIAMGKNQLDSWVVIASAIEASLFISLALYTYKRPFADRTSPILAHMAPVDIV